MKKSNINKKLICYVLSFIGILGLTGCGHSVQTNTKGVGIDLSWNGQSYIPTLRLGYWDASNAVLRGNTTYTTSTSTGGTLFSAGGSQTTTQLYAGPQLNEGNLEKILTSDKNSDAVKIETIKATMAAKPPMPAPSVARTSAAAGGTGEKLPQVDGISTGMDKVIETAGDVAKEALPVAGDVTKTVATTSTTTVQNAVQDITNTVIEAFKSTKVIVIALVIIVIIVGGIAAYIYFRKKKAQKESQNKTEEAKKQQSENTQSKADETPQNPVETKQEKKYEVVTENTTQEVIQETGNQSPKANVQ